MLVKEFCIKRGIPILYERMFDAFIRSSYAQALMTSYEGDTVKGIAASLPEEKLEKLWQEFVSVTKARLTEMEAKVPVKETDGQYDSIAGMCEILYPVGR